MGVRVTHIAISGLLALSGVTGVSANEELTVLLDDRNQTLILEENADYPASDAGAVHYAGHVRDNEDSWVRISRFADGSWSGIVSADDQIHSVEHYEGGKPPVARLFSELAGESEEYTCGTDDHIMNSASSAEARTGHSALFASPQVAMALDDACQHVDDVCAFVDIELVLDQEFQAAVGPDVQGNTDSIMNMVAGYYLNQFNVAFNITSTVLMANATDFLTSSSNSDTLLESFAANADRYRGGTDERIISHLLTGRDLLGTTLGVAFVNTFCGFDAVGLSSLNPRRDRQLTFTAATVAHEIGHNLGATHDGISGSFGDVRYDNTRCPVSGFVMNARLSDDLPERFSECSTGVISQNLTRNLNRSCMTAPSDVRITSGAVTGSPSVNGNLLIERAFTVSEAELGFRRDGVLGVALQAEGALINNATAGDRICQVPVGGATALCQIPADRVGDLDIRMNVFVLDQNVTLTATDQATASFKDTDPSNSRAQLQFAAGAGGGHALTISSSDMTSLSQPVISGMSSLRKVVC